MSVARFLKQRATAIQINKFEPYGILARDAVNDLFTYNRETHYYEISERENYER